MFRIQKCGFSTTALNSVRSRIDYQGPPPPPNKFHGRKVYGPEMEILDKEDYKTNFRGLRLFNKRHLREHKKLLMNRKGIAPKGYEDIPIHTYGTRSTGIAHKTGWWEHVPEKVPQLVVPDLTDCELKPYVSYRTAEFNDVSLNLIYFRSFCLFSVNS